jgi:hypothetical protein
VFVLLEMYSWRISYRMVRVRAESPTSHTCKGGEQMKTHEELLNDLEDAEIAYHNDIAYAEQALTNAERDYDEGKRKLGLL